MSSVISNVSPPPTPLVRNLQDHSHLGALRNCALISCTTSPVPCGQKYYALFISVNINPSTMPSVQPPELSAVYCLISMITISFEERYIVVAYYLKPTCAKHTHFPCVLQDPLTGSGLENFHMFPFQN